MLNSGLIYNNAVAKCLYLFLWTKLLLSGFNRRRIIDWVILKLKHLSSQTLRERNTCIPFLHKQSCNITREIPRAKFITFFFINLYARRKENHLCTFFRIQFSSGF